MLYKKYTVEVPLDLGNAIAKRVPETGYPSVRSYFIGLILYDLWCRRPHSLTLKVTQEPPAVRDGTIAQIGADYLAGKTGRLDASYFERYLKEIIDAEIGKHQADLEARQNAQAASAAGADQAIPPASAAPSRASETPAADRTDAKAAAGRKPKRKRKQ